MTIHTRLLLPREIPWISASRKKGFRWEGIGDDMRLVRVAGAAFHSYCSHAGIFRDFAALKPTPVAVLNFANRYGTLGQRPELNPFPFWRQGIQQMGELVTLSDAVTAGDWKRIPEALEPFLANASLAHAADIRPIRQKEKHREKVGGVPAALSSPGGLVTSGGTSPKSSSTCRLRRCVAPAGNLLDFARHLR